MSPLTIDSVTTEDAVPTVAPHRISALAGKNTATVAFTPTTAAGPVRAWRVTVGTNRKVGRLAGNLGCVCGLDRCGAPRVMPLAAASGVQRSEVITFVEASDGGADGARTVNVDALSDAGWL